MLPENNIEKIRYPSNAVLLQADAVQRSDRVRKDFGDLDELANSIRSLGLLQPPVVNSDNVLIGGERRFLALTTKLGLTEIPVIYFETLDEVHLRMLEAEENIVRQDFTWQETVTAVAEVHRLKEREAVLNRERWTLRSTGKLLNRSLGHVANAVTLAKHIREGDKDVIGASNARDALNVLIERKELAAQKHLAALTGGQLGSTTEQDSRPQIITEFTAKSMNYFDDVEGPGELVGGLGDDDEDPMLEGQTEAEQIVNVPITQMLYNVDMLEMKAILKRDSIDHIVTDIPYGIDMHNLDQGGTGMADIESVREEHDVEKNLMLYPQMFKVFDHVLRDDGFVVMWYDLDHHALLQELAKSHGFRVQRWPIVWVKTHPCKNQAAQYNWTKATEVAMVLRRGAATLAAAQPVNYILASNAALAEKLGHPFVKPREVWEYIYGAIAIRGQTVWDPFAGVGSATLAAIEHGLTPIASEINEAHYGRLRENVMDTYKKNLRGQVNFV